MPSKKLPPPDYDDDIEDADIIDGQFENKTQQQKVQDDELDMILTAINEDRDGAKWKIKVFETWPNKGTDGFLFECTPRELEHLDTRLLEEYGGGEYYVTIWRNGAYFRKKHPIPIGVDPTKVRRLALTRKPETGSNELVMVLQAMQQQNQQFLATLLQTMQQQNQQPQRDPLEVAFALSDRINAAKGSGSELNTLLKGFELAKEFGDGGREPSTGEMVMSALDKLSPLLTSALDVEKQKAVQMPMRPQPFQQRPPMQPQPINVNPNEPVNDMNIVQRLALKPEVDKLVKLASLEKDPDLYAEVTLDNIPQDYIVMFFNFIQQPNWFEQLVSLNPHVQQFRQWFLEWRDSCLELLTEAEEAAKTHDHETTTITDNPPTD